MSTSKPSMATELALLLLLASLWERPTFIKIGVQTIPPVTFIAARTLIAGLILVAVMRWRGLHLPRDAATWRRFLFQACLNSAIPFTMIAWAETSVDAGLATILNSTTPIFAFLMTAAITHHEPVTARKLFGVVVGISGICLVIGMEAFGGLGRDLLPQLAVVAATISYAGAAIFGRGFKGLPPIMPAAGSMICGAAILIPISLVVDQPWTPRVGPFDRRAARPVDLLDGAGVRDLLPADPYVAPSAPPRKPICAPIGVGIGVVFLGETLASTARAAWHASLSASPP